MTTFLCCKVGGSGLLDATEKRNSGEAVNPSLSAVIVPKGHIIGRIERDRNAVAAGNGLRSRAQGMRFSAGRFYANKAHCGVHGFGVTYGRSMGITFGRKLRIGERSQKG